MNNNRNFGFRSERHAALDMAYPADDFPERGMEPGPRSEGVGADFEVMDDEGSSLLGWFFWGLGILVVLLLAVHLVSRFV